MTNTQLLSIKREMKSRQPAFIREDSQRKEVSAKWRKPQGQQNKVRKGIHGHISMVKAGYRSPLEIRGYTVRQGVLPVVIHNLNQVSKLGKENGAILGAGVGGKKKVELIRALQEKKIPILNLIDANKFVEKVQNDLKERKEARKQRLARKTQKKVEKKETKTEKVEVKEEKSVEEQKKELDKMLTKKE